jgi:hypothetical protein
VEMLIQIEHCENQAKDSLLVARVSQAHFANAHRSQDNVFITGDKVLLSTTHCHNKYKDSDKACIAKFVCSIFQNINLHAQTAQQLTSVQYFPCLRTPMIHPQ